MILVGVTGGFCTGKTTVCNSFSRMGAHVINADKIVHRLYREDKKIKATIRKKFGEGVFTRGKIDRAKLGKIAFADKRKLNMLSAIAHPETIKRINREVKKAKVRIVVLDAPLLIETGLDKLVDFIVVVRTTFAKQAERCVRSGRTKRDFLLRRKAQMPITEKIKCADFIIDNNRSKRETDKEARRIWQLLKRG